MLVLPKTASVSSPSSVTVGIGEEGRWVGPLTDCSSCNQPVYDYSITRWCTVD